MENLVDTDVLVVGAGNAAMSAAVAAREQGVDVVVLEKAPKSQRGGNSALTVHMRFPYRGMEDLVPLLSDVSEEVTHSLAERVGAYTESDYYDDIMEVTDGQSDPTLANILVSDAYETVLWMRSYGHAWIPSHESPTSANVVSFDGGGFAMQERWFHAAERLGIPVHYETQALDLLQDRAGRVTGVRARTGDRDVRYKSRAVILACGSFESSPEMRAQYLGTGWDKVKLRGVPFNTGDGLNMALELGAQPYGSWSTCHASPQDSNRPDYDLPGPGVSGVYWSRYSYPFGIMMNVDGRRFVDEGETWRGLTYAKTGRAILSQPSGLAFQIFGAEQRRRGLIRGYEDATGFKSNTLEALAKDLEIHDVSAFLETVHQFNASIQDGEFHPFRLDGKSTSGISPPKSNWALPIATPPFEAYPTICGMTFTYGGLKITPSAEVLHEDDHVIPGLYAAGEMVGGLWHDNYPSGGGMMAGAVFGCIAGTKAAQQVLRHRA